MVLRFGKFKGQEFSNTPEWYQQWLLKQEWFKLEAPKSKSNRVNSRPAYAQSLAGWNGYSAWGQAIEDAIFENDAEDQDLTNDELYEKYN